MRNPLRKRYKRELKSDFGKYAVIFVFMVLFIGIVSGFLVSDNSVSHSYYEGFTKYNIEDGHLAFKSEVEESLLNEIASENNLTFYNLFYKNESIDGKDINLRIYQKREEINTECVMSGELPSDENGIALDRMFAENNNISVGDKITVKGNDYTVTGFIAVPDYSSLFENNSDMMFDAFHFGVAVTTKEGFNRIGNAHLKYNYAWKYNTAPKDDTEENSRSEVLIDSLTDIIKRYDESIVQTQVDEVFAKAKIYAEKLEKDFEIASNEIEKKLTAAGEKAAEKAVSSLSTEDMMSVITEKSGMSKTELITKVITSSGLKLTDYFTLGLDALMKGEDAITEDIMKLTGKSKEELMNLVLEATGISQEEIGEALVQKALKKENTTLTALIAKELGTSENALNEMTSAFEKAKSLSSDMDKFSEPPKIDFDNLKNGKDLNIDTDFSLDEIYDILDKVSATGLYDVSDIRKLVDKINGLANFKIDESGLIEISDYAAKYQNRAIIFTGDDMSNDKASIKLFTYIVMIILAFVFAVTTSNTIQKEAGVIGTLRASGYSRGELVRHYLVLPIVVTLVASVIGNILGYTLFESFFVKIYYTNYSLCTYETLWNLDAFKETTIVPIAIMLIVNIFLLTKKMRTPPLSFLRGETTNKKKKRALPLSPKLPIFTRLRIRVLIQNISSYIILFLGIVIGGTICVFGSMFGPLCEDYQKLVIDEQICDYQYILTNQKEIENAEAEKFSMTSLDTMKEGYIKDSVVVYGIENNSRYVTAQIPSGMALISNGMAEKFGLSVGDEVILKEPYGTQTYLFKVAGIYEYPGALSIFLPRAEFNMMFGKENDYFTGYFSNTELTELSDEDIATSITAKDLTKVASQLGKSMGEMMSMFKGFGIIIFLLLMFLLTKQIIDKNSQSISMSKILGFSNREIGGLYLVMTSIVVIISLLLSIPIIHAVLKWAFTVYIYKEMSGYIPYIVSNSCYVFMFVSGMISYAAVCLVMLLKIRKVSKGEVLKNQMV